MKRYEYKIFSKTGSYITTWNDVISEPVYDYAINAGLGALTVTLKRPFSNFGEGQDVWFENQLRLYVFDKENPDGKLIYTGRLNEYKPYFDKQERVDVNFVGYYTELDDRYLRDETSDDAINSEYLVGSGNVLNYKLYNQKFNPDPTSGYLALAYKFTNLHTNITRVGVQAFIDKSGNYQQNTVIGIMQADLINGIDQQGNSVAYYRPGKILASGVVQTSTLPSGIANVGIQEYTSVALNTKLYVEPDQPYYYFIAASGVSVPVVTVSDNPSLGWSGIDTAWGWSFGTNVATTTPVATNTNATAWMAKFGGITFFSNTSPRYESEDPTSIAADIINNKYSGTVKWKSDNPLTNYVVSYQFNKTRVSDAIKKCIDMADPNWYFYIDENNQLIFKKRDFNVIHHTLRLGYEIQKCAPVKTVNELKTRTLFIGGTGAGAAELYDEEDWWWQNEQYTLREQLLQDGRVTIRNTAKQFERTFLDARSRPTTSMRVDVLDSNSDAKYGYDIESFAPGQYVRVIDPQADNYQTQDGIYESGFIIDETQLDISDTHILSEPLQILRIHYTKRMATLDLGTIIVDTPRRIEDIYREQEKNNTKDTSLS